MNDIIYNWVDWSHEKFIYTDRTCNYGTIEDPEIATKWAYIVKAQANRLYNFNWPAFYHFTDKIAFVPKSNCKVTVWGYLSETASQQVTLVLPILLTDFCCLPAKDTVLDHFTSLYTSEKRTTGFSINNKMCPLQGVPLRACCITNCIICSLSDY